MSPESRAWRAESLVNPADGARIPLFRHGSGDPLVLLHGWTLDHRAFFPQSPLGADVELVAPDRRGFGVSEAAPNLGAEIADIDTIIDATGAEAVHLLGVSQGARIALRYAAARPQRLRSLILQGLVIDGYDPPIPDDAPIPLAHYADLVRAGEIDRVRHEWLEHPLMSSDTLSPERRSELVAMVSAYRGTDLLAAGSPGAPPALLPMLAELDLPTLIITGERETAARKAHAARLRETLRNAREVTLRDCGHLSNASDPQAYNAAVRDFLRDVAG